MTVLAHISDLHFGREYPRLIAGLLQSLEEINPQLIVVTGDITQRARSREFQEAREFLERLSWPLLVISGNHDIPAHNIVERFLDPWRKWRRYFGYPLEPVRRDKDSIVIGVNTARRSGSHFDWSRGSIGSSQVDTIAGYLAEEKGDRLRVIAAHHPFWLPKKYRHRHVIGGRDPAMNTLKKAGVDIILSGHVHFAYTHVLDGVVISHAGSAISSRLEAGSPNSFKVVRGDRQRLSVETIEWNDKSFIHAVDQVFSRSQGEWTET
ncbi:MAG: restriction endonuclease EcoEI subunit S [Desulfobulbaceae bacterium BRH_c16a]|nr:MAG: restriction endonuclease EcoEI subunit S [Desulfobulbaceae bacterium BRH_c16a]